MNKQLLEKYGKGMKPIPATRVWSRLQTGFKTQAETVIIVNDNTKKVTYVNLYSGRACKNWDYNKSTFDFKPEVLNKKLSRAAEKDGKPYSAVSVQDCPITTEAQTPTTETTATETTATETTDQQGVAASQPSQTI